MIDLIRDTIKYRSLIWALVVRHLAVRYRGSVLGFLWSLLNPLCLMLVYLLVFRFYIRFNQVENYTVFIFSGLLPWIWFSSAISEGTSAITSSGHLITKSMFPAHVLPVVAIITTMVHFLLSLPLLLIFMMALGVSVKATMLAVPVVLVLQFLFSLGAVLALGALNVQYRDVQHLVSNSLQFLFFLSPIIYPETTVPERLRFTLELNPLALLTVFYHNLIIDGTLPSAASVLYVSVWVGIVLLSGVIVYDRYREKFAELL